MHRRPDNFPGVNRQHHSEILQYGRILNVEEQIASGEGVDKVIGDVTRYLDGVSGCYLDLYTMSTMSTTRDFDVNRALSRLEKKKYFSKSPLEHKEYEILKSKLIAQ